MATEFYDLAKRAFIESLALASTPISFLSNEKQCIAHPINRTSFPGESGGFVLEADVQVSMLDTDFDSWAGAGVENTSFVEIDGLTLQILGVRREPADPIVELTLKKSK